MAECIFPRAASPHGRHDPPSRWLRSRRGKALLRALVDQVPGPVHPCAVQCPGLLTYPGARPPCAALSTVEPTACIQDASIADLRRWGNFRSRVSATTTAHSSTGSRPGLVTRQPPRQGSRIRDQSEPSSSGRSMKLVAPGRKSESLSFPPTRTRRIEGRWRQQRVEELRDPSPFGILCIAKPGIPWVRSTLQIIEALTIRIDKTFILKKQLATFNGVVAAKFVQVAITQEHRPADRPDIRAMVNAAKGIPSKGHRWDPSENGAPGRGGYPEFPKGPSYPAQPLPRHLSNAEAGRQCQTHPVRMTGGPTGVKAYHRGEWWFRNVGYMRVGA
jgi:hypothetical protein